jgi:predicted Zn finger-like uncharacterized protein
MEMVTTCPHCGTSFRVTPDHLRARAGQVRCGRCTTVFDGFQALTARDALKPSATAHDVPREPSPPQPVAEEMATAAHESSAVEVAADAAPFAEPAESVTAVTMDGLLGPVEQPTSQVLAEAVAPVPEAPVDIELLNTQDLVAPALPVHDQATAQSSIEAAASANVIVESPEQDIYRRLTPVESVAMMPPTAMASPVEHDYPLEEEAPKRRNLLWTFAAVVAVVVLAGQAIHVYRSELASKYPAFKPALAQFCEYAACKVLPLQRPDALKIEASDLQVTDPSRPSVIQLTATLRNYSSSEVGYPALDLVLTDNREHTLVRRVFAPADYLARPDALATGIAANAEVTVRIDIDVGSLGAAGFRLNLASALSI